MLQIRLNVFETNSSSTHSICVAKDGNSIKLPEKVDFKFGEFGWEHDTLQSIDEKASYLYTGIVNHYHQINDTPEDYIEYIKNILKDLGVEAIFQKKSTGGYWESGYIDHGYELTEFLDDLRKDRTKLINFLFSPLSYIITGNDNDDYDYDVDDKYIHDELCWDYYKGN